MEDFLIKISNIYEKVIKSSKYADAINFMNENAQEYSKEQQVAKEVQEKSTIKEEEGR